MEEILRELKAMKQKNQKLKSSIQSLNKDMELLKQLAKRQGLSGLSGASSSPVKPQAIQVGELIMVGAGVCVVGVCVIGAYDAVSSRYKEYKKKVAAKPRPEGSISWL